MPTQNFELESRVSSRAALAMPTSRGRRRSASSTAPSDCSGFRSSSSSSSSSSGSRRELRRRRPRSLASSLPSANSLLLLLHFLFLSASFAPADALRPLACANQRILYNTYENLEGTWQHFYGLYYGYAIVPPRTVPEHIKAYQLQSLAQDFTDVLEAFRTAACLLLCPNACTEGASASTGTEALLNVPLVESLNNLQLDLEVITDDAVHFKAVGQQVLREAKQYATTLLAAPLGVGAKVDWEEAITVCLAAVVSRVMFPIMKVVALSGKENKSQTILRGVSFEVDNPASYSGSYLSPRMDLNQSVSCAQGRRRGDEQLEDACSGLVAESGEPSFMLLQSLSGHTAGSAALLPTSSPLQVPSGICSRRSSPHLIPAKKLTFPRRWRQGFPISDEEGQGAVQRKEVPKFLQILQHIEALLLDQSFTYLVLRPKGGDKWSLVTSCEGTGLEYDPTDCLESLGYAGFIYNVNIHPPFHADVKQQGVNLGDRSMEGGSMVMDVLRPIADSGGAVSIEHIFYKIDMTWRQLDEPSPDVFFLHPAVHNCYSVEYLFGGSALKPKVMIIPINPVIPPPFEVQPRFETWWHILRPLLASSPRWKPWLEFMDDQASDVPPPMPTMYEDLLDASIWFGQCSLSAVEKMLRDLEKRALKYVLHHVDGPYAVYVRLDVHKALTRGDPKEKPDAYVSWLRGWFCKPESRYFDLLEALAGAEVQRSADPSVPLVEREAALCRFLYAQRIPVESRNFNCKANMISSQGGAGEHSCLRTDLRGWGNEQVVSDTVQPTVKACEDYCLSLNCTYWTYDPTELYGQPLCWAWTGGRPAELKEEKGWISGDVDCRTSMRSMLDSAAADAAPARPVPQAPEAPPEPRPERVQEQVAATLPVSEDYRAWAIAKMEEVPGVRYFLESSKRGRCSEGFCECFPPWRGPLCQLVEPSTVDASHRNYSAVLHYLTSDGKIDIDDIEQSLPRLWKMYNQYVDYPVVIFHDGLSMANRHRIVHASENRIWFAYVDDYLQVPEMFSKDPDRKARLDEVKWSLGYRGMCRFRSGTIFLQPVLQGFDYAMTLDTDGYFPAPILSDPIAEMHAGDYVYTWSHLLPDLPGAVMHFWEYSLMYMRMKNIHPLGTPILRQFVNEDDIRWNYQLYMNDIEIVKLDWFRSDPYQDYFRYLDSVGGFWLHRWGDHAVRTIAVGMWLPEDKVYEMDIPYGHQNYCKCSDAHPDKECIREGTIGGSPEKWFTCAPIAVAPE